MKIVQGDELPLKRGLEHRGGTFHYSILAEGEPGTPGNFQVSLGRIGGDFFSPRHRHNFEQIRFQLEGALDFGRDGRLLEGMVGYFPEGVAYGPQTQKSEQSPATTIVLQCGGASGSGYLSAEEVQAGMAALKQQGEFKDGVFRRRDDVEGRRNTDGYQAIWEYVNGRAMVYPEGRYITPILSNPASFDWVPVGDRPGVAEKPLGVFTERRTSMGFLRIEAGSRYTIAGKAIYLVMIGVGSGGGASLRRLSTVTLEAGETMEISASKTMEILRFGLPDLSRLKQREDQAEAAE